MRKLNKIIITAMDIKKRPCLVCALKEESRVMEIRLEPRSGNSILGNIYVGQVEKVAENIKAAFVRFGNEGNGYFPLEEAEHVIYTAGRRGNAPLHAGDEILVQVSRDAMKGKLPALSSNLSFTGKYLVLTTGNKKFGLSSKLSGEDRSRLSKWLEDEAAKPDKEYGIIVRTNAADASKEEIIRELEYLKKLYTKAAILGRNRTCFSLLQEAESFYISAVRDAYSNDVKEIITDIPEVYHKLQEYLTEFSPSLSERLVFYEDSLLPLYKLHSLESALEEIQREKVWMKNGGFLMIQQTEAFVSIDVNSGKYTGKKKAEETYRKINLEAAGEIARQVRLRNLSGIILVDFINMENPDHRDELFHVLQKYLRKDSVKCKAVDITPLNILEMTRKKIRRPVIEDIRELQQNNGTEQKSSADSDICE